MRFTEILFALAAAAIGAVCVAVIAPLVSPPAACWPELPHWDRPQVLHPHG